MRNKLRAITFVVSALVVVDCGPAPAPTPAAETAVLATNIPIPQPTVIVGPEETRPATVDIQPHAPELPVPEIKSFPFDGKITVAKNQIVVVTTTPISDTFPQTASLLVIRPPLTLDAATFTLLVVSEFHPEEWEVFVYTFPKGFNDGYQYGVIELAVERAVMEQLAFVSRGYCGGQPCTEFRETEFLEFDESSSPEGMTLDFQAN